jgi:hypothetical protein
VWRCAPLVALAACGRLDFEPAAGSAPFPRLIQAGSLLATPPTQPVLGMVPTHAGDLLLVATVDIDSGPPIVSISDDTGNAYVSANASYTESCCTGEIWYVPAAAADTTTITIADSVPVRREIWLLELADANALVGAVALSAATANGSAVIGPLVTTTTTPAIVMSTINTGSVGSVDPSYTPLPDLNADDAAWRIVVVPGEYGPVWSIGGVNAEFAGATVAFAAE